MSIMEERSKTIEHKGFKIWYTDYSNLHGDEFLQYIERNIERFMSRPEDELNNSLVLINLTDSTIRKDVFAAAEKSMKTIRPYYKAVAVVGVAGMKKVLVDIVTRVTSTQAKAFNDINTALDWLAEQKQ